MNLIGFSSQATALLLANYLRGQGIQTKVVEGEFKGDYIVVLQHADDHDKAHKIAQEFIQQPRHPRYQEAAWESSEKVKLVPTGTFKKVNLKSFIDTPFTSLILLTCILVYVGSLLGFFRLFAQLFQIVPMAELIESGQWWRIIGPAFLHFSALHIIFNVLWWWVLGRPMEEKFGSSFMLLFFLITAAVSNVAQLMVSGPNFGGLSGVVYALMGFVWWIGWLRPTWGLSLPTPLVGFMLFWLVLGYADVLWVSMANTAHTAGLISGCLLALAMVKLAQNKKV